MQCLIACCLSGKLKSRKSKRGYSMVSESKLIVQKKKVSPKFYNLHLFSNDTLPYEPSSQASSSSIPRIWIWSIKLNSWEYSRKDVCDVHAHKAAMRAKLRSCMTANRVADFMVEGQIFQLIHFPKVALFSLKVISLLWSIHLTTREDEVPQKIYFTVY